MRAAAAALILASALAPASARADATDACIASAERGQELRRAGRLVAARDALIACSNAACPRAIGADCRRWLGEVEASIPTLVVRVIDAEGRDVADAQLLVDGAAAARSNQGRALPLDPGEHELRVERRTVTVAERVVVREGDRDRVVTLALPSSVAPSRAAIPAATWIVGGAGVAAIGLGVGLWISGRSDRADLYASCGTTRACTASDKDGAQAKLVAGDVAAGVGVAALGAAVAIALLTGVPKSAGAHVGARVVPSAGGGAIVGYGAF